MKTRWSDDRVREAIERIVSTKEEVQAILRKDFANDTWRHVGLAVAPGGDGGFILRIVAGGAFEASKIHIERFAPDDAVAQQYKAPGSPMMTMADYFLKLPVSREAATSAMTRMREEAERFEKKGYVEISTKGLKQ